MKNHSDSVHNESSIFQFSDFTAAGRGMFFTGKDFLWLTERWELGKVLWAELIL